MHPPNASVPAGHPSDGAGPWVALTASARGATHVAAGLPNQDAAGTAPADSAAVVSAVADGHGHRRHLRSARGSRIAVTVGIDVGRDLARQVLGEPGILSPLAEADGAAAVGRLGRLLAEFTAPEIVRRWRVAVLEDLAAEPFSAAEQEQRVQADDPVIAYGSTLLLAVTIGQWLLLAQIGDGDVVAVGRDGSGLRPVPGDPLLDGQATTSLCGRHAVGDFRFAVVDTLVTPVVAVLLATDGYGNAQLADDWPDAFSRDLAALLQERDERWIAEQLPGWAARCASSDGSADDTSVVLLISPGALAPRTLTPPGGQAASDSGSAETTIPAKVQ